MSHPLDSVDPQDAPESSAQPGAAAGDVIRCDACPVLCRIRKGQSGACDRYANLEGKLVRSDPLVILQRSIADGREVVPFLEPGKPWDGSIVSAANTFVTGIGATTTYPDYKPAPFIV
ncbi:MAG: 6-hydroxynicotinate reductase, partial [Betaproteobacteria bacterium]